MAYQNVSPRDSHREPGTVHSNTPSPVDPPGEGGKQVGNVGESNPKLAGLDLDSGQTPVPQGMSEKVNPRKEGNQKAAQGKEGGKEVRERGVEGRRGKKRCP